MWLCQGGNAICVEVWGANKIIFQGGNPTRVEVWGARMWFCQVGNTTCAERLEPKLLLWQRDAMRFNIYDGTVSHCFNAANDILIRVCGAEISSQKRCNTGCYGSIENITKKKRLKNIWHKFENLRLVLLCDQQLSIYRVLIGNCFFPLLIWKA